MLTDALIDNRTISAHHSGHEVLAQAHLVVWPDESSLRLHLVRKNGVITTWLRAVQSHKGVWFLFDVRRVAHVGFEHEVQVLPPRDRQGMVFYALRLHFRSADDCTDHISDVLAAVWTDNKPEPRHATR